MKKKTSATDSAKWSALQRRCAANAMDQDSIILKAEANSCRFYCAATCSRFGYTFHGCCCSRSSSIETIWPNTLDFHRSLSHKSWKLRPWTTKLKLSGSVMTIHHVISRFARHYNEAKIATGRHWSNAADHRPTDGCQWNRSSIRLDVYDIFQA